MDLVNHVQLIALAAPVSTFVLLVQLDILTRMDSASPAILTAVTVVIKTNVQLVFPVSYYGQIICVIHALLHSM